MSDKNYSSGGTGLVGVLTVIFVVLKMLGLISWSWLWVLSPIWIPLALFFISVIIAFVATVIMAYVFGKQ